MKTTLDVYDLNGKVTSKVDVPSQLTVDVDPNLIALAVRVYLANQRQSTSKAKSRGEINKTTHKIWKQKGTGRARHGNKAAPIFVGGGVAHGPTGEENYTLKLNKKMRKKAILSAFSQAIADKKIMVVSGLESMKSTTKDAVSLEKALKIDGQKTVLLLEQPFDNVIRATSNRENIQVSQAQRTNVYELVSADKIIIHQPAVNVFASTFAQVKVVEEKPVKKAPKKASLKG